MSSNDFNLEEERKSLVLARFKALNQDSKVLLGGDKEYTVRDLIKSIEQGDAFGKRVVDVQIKMLQILSQGVS